MRRWLLRTPWFTLRIHKIQQSDSGRDFHDHPFDFTSLILSGGYLEHRPGCQCFSDEDVRTRPTDDCRVYLAGDVVRRKAEDFHRLELYDDRPTWTFVISSAYRREWGFIDRGHWVHHEDYKLRFNRGVSHP
jgi:hypothetical protein